MKDRNPRTRLSSSHTYSIDCFACWCLRTKSCLRCDNFREAFELLLRLLPQISHEKDGGLPPVTPEKPHNPHATWHAM